MEFESILTQNKDVLEDIKLKSNIVEYLKNEVKVELSDNMREYDANIKMLFKNKNLLSQLEKLNKTSSSILQILV